MFHNYKEQGDTFRKVFQEIDYWFTDAVADHGDFRFVEPPDGGLYRYDPDTIHFGKMNSLRDACNTMGYPGCSTPPPKLMNRPPLKELETAFEYDVKGAGGAGAKPCRDSFCRDNN
jgi:hypothetical protein